MAAILCGTPAPDAAGNVPAWTDLGEVWDVVAANTRWTLMTEGLPPVQSVLNMTSQFLLQKVQDPFFGFSLSRWERKRTSVN